MNFWTKSCYDFKLSQHYILKVWLFIALSMIFFHNISVLWGKCRFLSWANIWPGPKVPTHFFDNNYIVSPSYSEIVTDSKNKSRALNTRLRRKCHFCGTSFRCFFKRINSRLTAFVALSCKYTLYIRYALKDK